MKKLFIGLILSPLVMFSAAPPPPATQAEVDAGLDSYKYVTPKTLGLTTLIGTNAGISAATGTNIAAYQAQIATNNLTTVKDPLVIDHALVDWFFDILSGGGNSLVVYQTGGSATPLFTFTDGGYFIPLNGFQGDGSLVTNVNGTNIQSLTISNAVIANNTINSNKLDAATRALLGAAASSGLLEVDSNGRLATTNLVDRYETNTLTIGQGPPANLNSAIHFVGGATPHIETFGASSWWDFNTPVTNADVVHFSSVVVMDPDNVVFGAGTLALATATATTPAENDNDTSVATTAYVQTEIAGFGSGQTNVTDTAAYGSTVNSNLLVKGTLTVNGASSFTDLTVTNFVIATNWDASLATNLNGTEIRSGTVADARIASTITRDTEWDTVDEINTATSRTIVTNGSSPSLLTVTADGFDVRTNSWTINGVLYMGTNATYTGGAATIGITGVGGTIGSAERFGSLTIKSTGDIVFTNPASFYASDGVDTRTFTNGNLTTVTVQLIPGFSTNLIYSWSK